MCDEPALANNIEGHSIATRDRYYVVWDGDHLETQRKFLGKIDPDYFQYCSDTHAVQLESENRTRAEIALRFNYSHAIECMFSLIGAAIQAPFCPAGWIIMATNSSLYSVVNAISQRNEIPNAINLTRLQWPKVVKALNPLDLADDIYEEHCDSIELLWKHLASQFIDDDFREEYNSIKHGMRVRSTPWFVNIGTEPSPGVPSTKMTRWAESDSGSNFLRKVRLKEHQWQLRDGRSNWHPKQFVELMPLIVRSIRNLKHLLLGQNGADSSTISFTLFTLAEVDKALAFRSSDRKAKFSLWMNIPQEALEDLTPTQIRAEYESKTSAFWEDD